MRKIVGVTTTPWTLDQDDRGFWHVRTRDDSDDVNNYHVTTERDARLIAAAPDLLAVVDGLLDRLANHYDDPDRFDSLSQVKQARAAIAKATP